MQYDFKFKYQMDYFTCPSYQSFKFSKTVSSDSESMKKIITAIKNSPTGISKEDLFKLYIEKIKLNLNHFKNNEFYIIYNNDKLININDETNLLKCGSLFDKDMDTIKTIELCFKSNNLNTDLQLTKFSKLKLL